MVLRLTGYNRNIILIFLAGHLLFGWWRIGGLCVGGWIAGDLVVPGYVGYS